LNEDAFSLLKNGDNAAYLSANAAPISGFMGYKALDSQKKSLLFGSEDMGRGSIVYLVDNVLFRGFWYSGKMIFANALFF